MEQPKPDAIIVTIKPDGFVNLVQRMGDDNLIAEAATIGRGSKDVRRLIRYMMRHKHTSPFEFVRFVFHVRLPIFVARQWMRHRACVFNEWSARYMEMPDKFWMPEKWRPQAIGNNQGSAEGEVRYEESSWESDVCGARVRAEEAAFTEYDLRIAAGISREQARSCLPVSTYTEFYWGIDLHNLLNFLRLRSDSHAQAEIRDYADAILSMVEHVCPITVGAWKEYARDSITFTALECAFLSGKAREIEWETIRESVEFHDRAKRAGFMLDIPEYTERRMTQ